MTLTDQADRDRAWQCFDRNLNVAAGAGTGKTRVLVDRYLAWILGQAWRRFGCETAVDAVSSIVAITFTEKAAGEMQERIAHSLRVIAHDEDVGLSEFEHGHVAGLRGRIAALYGVNDDVIRRRAGAALEQAHRMEVSTIHSFAARVLRTWPVAAGVHPDYQVDTEGALRYRALRDAFVTATREALLGERSADAVEMLLTLGESDLMALLSRLLDSETESVPLYQPANLDAETAAAAKLLSLCRRARTGARRDRARKLKRVMSGLERLCALLSDPEVVSKPAACRQRTDKDVLAQLRSDLHEWTPEWLVKALGPAMAMWRKSVPIVRRTCRELSMANPTLLSTALELYAPVVGAVRERLMSDGLLSFDDLLTLTERLLSSHADVAAGLAQRYGQILVDEFQDTSPDQCRILQAVLEAADGARVFLVGDPKQSIYAFRGADLSAYEGFSLTMDEQLSLVANFRSQARLMTAMNRAFARLFEPEAGLQPGPQALEPARPAAPGPAVHIWDVAVDDDGDDQKAEEARALEASAITRAILAFDAANPVSGKRWTRFAVLSRVQSEASRTVEALEAAGIPCVVSGDKEFYRRQEVLDTANLLRVLLDPADGVAWVGLLRSPLGAVPDPVLLDLAREGFFAAAGARTTVQRAREHSHDPERRQHLARLDALLERLGELRALLFDDSIERWLDAMLSWLPLEAIYATEYLGERKVANVTRVLRGFARAAVTGDVPLRDWLADVVKHLVGRHEESETALADETTDAVRVMSIHASKGLQFDHVFVPRLDWAPASGMRDRVDLDVSDGQLRLRVGDHATFGMESLEEARQRVDEAETVRLLYVACTRARETLTLMGRMGSGVMSPLVQQGFVPLRDGDCVVDAVAAETNLEAPSRADGEHLVVGDDLVALSVHWWDQRDAQLAGMQTERLVRTASGAEPAEDDAPVDRDFDAPLDDDEAGSMVQQDLFSTGPSTSRQDAIDFGVEVHAALEVWDGAADYRPTGLKGEARTVVTEFVASALADRVRAAEQVYRELPFVASGDDATEVGVMDLLLKERDGWTVVDYKTNRVRNRGHAEQVAEHYRLQSELYSSAVRRALGIDEVRFELWFLRGLHAVTLEATPF